MDWNNGYVADIAYPAGFFPEQSPTHLSVACILNGVEPPPPDRPFTYFELGAGVGLTAAVLAASHPHGRFFANDFQPAHVSAAQAMIDDARLDNLTMLESSFADLAAGLVDLPPLDYITMYGVYSWVNAENRRHIVDFIARYLKPGGVVFVNYNAMPGGSGVGPLQRLMLDYADSNPGPRDAQIDGARDLVDQMIAAGARHFDGNAALTHRLRSLREDNVQFLAHEYLNHGAEPLYHADVARQMALAKLDYVGPADPSAAIGAIVPDARERALLANCHDPLLRETLRDFLRNTVFRDDVMVRGARRMAPHRQQFWLAQLGVARLTLAQDDDSADALPRDTDPAQAEMLREPLRALMRALPNGAPIGLAALAALPGLEGYGLAGVARLAALLASSRRAVFCFLDSVVGVVDPAPAARLNRVIARHAVHEDRFHVLASPVLGTGLPVGLVQRLVLGALTETRAGETVDGGRADDRDADDAALAAALSERIAPQLAGQLARAKGAAAEQLQAVLSELPGTVAAIVRLRVPVWRAQEVL